MLDSLCSTYWRHDNTNRKIGIRLTAIIIATLLLPLAYTPLAVAQSTLPSTIIGGPILSQGKEGDSEGYFIISDIIQTGGSDTRGTFTAHVTYTFWGGPGPDRVVLGDGDVVGKYAMQKGTLMLQFKGDGFRGQLRSDPSGFLIGFINTPGNGFLTQVFVAGVPEYI